MTITQFPTHTPPCAAVWDNSGQSGIPAPDGVFHRICPLSPEETRTHGAPGETQHSGFAGERKNGGMSEPCCLRRGEGYEARSDDKQDKGMASEPTPLPLTTARSAGSYGGFTERPFLGSNTATKQALAVITTNCADISSLI